MARKRDAAKEILRKLYEANILKGFPLRLDVARARSADL